HAGAKVERPFVVTQLAEADVEGLIVDQQTDDLAVGHVDPRLPSLGVAIAGLAIAQRTRFVETAEVRAGEATGLALVQICAQPKVPIAQSKQRFRVDEHVQAQRGLAEGPRLHGEGRVLDHEAINSARSDTTISAPWWRNSS